jgi:DNA-binding Lrp family transcriptional regulator
MEQKAHKIEVESLLIRELGLVRAIVLKEIMEKCTSKTEFTAITYDDIQENIPFITRNKIQYSIKMLRKEGIIESINNKRDGRRVNAYKVKYENLIEIYKK